MIDDDLTERMRNWAALRNVLAHQYVGIDFEIIADALQHELGDLERFAEAANRWLDEAGRD